MKKRSGIATLTLLFLGLIGNWYSVNLIRQWIFDLSYQNTSITSREGIKKVLEQFKSVPFSELDEVYLEATDAHLPKYKKLLRGSVYYRVPARALQQKIVGNFRLRDFVSRDMQFFLAHYGLKREVYLLLDTKLLYKLLELEQELERHGYAAEAFSIICAHRHPKYNNAINGVSNSRHILGQAIDLEIGDVDQDGRYTTADKDIVLKILDGKVIGNSGGIVRYPGSRVVHFDTRGDRARWDKQ